MTAEQEWSEVQVRALDGRSTVVKLPLGASVRDLKAALRTSFLPAQVSPSFHLFLKVPRNSLPASSFPACAKTVSLHHGILALIPHWVIRLAVAASLSTLVKYSSTFLVLKFFLMC
jgi:hypothetical protein